MRQLRHRLAQQVGHGIHPDVLVRLIRHEGGDHVLPPSELRRIEELVSSWERANGTSPTHRGQHFDQATLRLRRDGYTHYDVQIPSTDPDVIAETVRLVKERLDDTAAEAQRNIRSIVGVRFDGSHSRIYHYKVLPEDRDQIDLGDRVAVESPLSGHTEFPVVYQWGYANGFRQATKYARALPRG